MKKLFALLVLLLCWSLPAAGDSSSHVQVLWPPLEGFHHETIPFPLDFAPQIHHTGFEELRFAPGFGKPDAPDYFTYSFVWVLSDTNPLSLQNDLTAYFQGLMAAVAQEKKRPANHFKTKVSVAPFDTGYAAVVETWDAFFTGQGLRLTIHVSQEPNSVHGYRLYYFEVSPHMDSEAVQTLMRQVRAQFKGLTVD